MSNIPESSPTPLADDGYTILGVNYRVVSVHIPKTAPVPGAYMTFSISDIVERDFTPAGVIIDVALRYESTCTHETGCTC